MNTEQYISWLAATIADDLGTIDGTRDYNIAPQLGSYKFPAKQGKIRHPQKPPFSGVLISRPDNLVPIHGYELFTISSMLKLTVPVGDEPGVLNALGQWVINNNGLTVSFRDIEDDPNTEGEQGHVYDVQYSLSFPNVTNVTQRGAAGTSAEITLLITTEVSHEAVRGNDVKAGIVYTENGTEKTEFFQVLQSAWQVIKSYDNDNAGNDEYVNSSPTSQTLTLTLKVAYRKTTKLMEIMNDILDGDLQKTYVISYSDGAAVPHGTPKKITMTLGQGTQSNAPGVLAALDLVFYKKVVLGG